VAWDTVEEISSAADKKRSAEAAKDPMEEFCKSAPDADECRVGQGGWRQLRPFLPLAATACAWPPRWCRRHAIFKREHHALPLAMQVYED
jgi:hypothetical protein